MADILAVDSSTKHVSCALMSEGGIRESSYIGERPVSATLLQQIDSLLALAGLKKNDLDSLALGSGPGSFTGMRVSFSLIKAIADALTLPLICVDSLDTIAAPYLSGGATVAVFQLARKGFAYYAEYRKGKRASETAFFTPAQCSEAATALPAGSILAGNGCSGFFQPPECCLILNPEGAPRASWTARLAMSRYKAGKFTPFDKALPEYMRPSDAEEKAGINNG